ncbi:hypothetical protein TESS_TESS_01993 [Tessaracoccus sp. O5.2]|uniref:DUF6167 family protein n=1 Tax=Tessaracoccus sp. O5.2 TaxID=3157622 RepID=UPI0035EBA282
MSRLFWLLVGAGLAVFVVLRGKQLLYQVTPRGVQDQVVEQGHRAAASFGDFVATFRAAAAEREAELRRELNLPTPTR